MDQKNRTNKKNQDTNPLIISNRLSIKKNFLEKIQALQDLHLPFDSYSITGSGPLAIRGLREAHDIDIVVSASLWQSLEKKYPKTKPNLIKIGNIEIWNSFLNLTPHLEKSIKSSDRLDEYPFMSLQDTISWKQFYNRKKDRLDIETIKQYLKLVPGIYQKRPKDFQPELISVACYMHYQNKYIFLQKAKNHWSEFFWGIPCGRLEKNETLSQAMERELKEEIGFVAEANNLFYEKCFYVISFERTRYLFHTFSYILKEKIPIILSSEHQNYQWLSLEEALQENLIPNQAQAITYFKAFYQHAT